MDMEKASSQTNLVDRSILLLLAASVASLYVGVQLAPHPDFSGADDYKTEYAAKQPHVPKSKESVAKPALGSVPESRPDIGSFSLSYNLPSQAEVAVIPAIFTPAMPTGIATLPVQDRKQLFVRIMLPLILSANKAIRSERVQLEDADATILASLAKQYRVEAETLTQAELRSELDKRIRPIPVSLALAQAAIESGWGTSRFTKEANALYGQWAWRAQDGVKPLEASNSRAVIRKFDTLQASVQSYMKNLNSHYAYAEFREGRANIIARNKIPDGMHLARYLTSYAETGAEYVDTIRSVITRNKFTNFDRLTLSNTGT